MPAGAAFAVDREKESSLASFMAGSLRLGCLMKTELRVTNSKRSDRRHGPQKNLRLRPTEKEQNVSAPSQFLCWLRKEPIWKRRRGDVDGSENEAMLQLRNYLQSLFPRQLLWLHYQLSALFALFFLFW